MTPELIQKLLDRKDWDVAVVALPNRNPIILDSETRTTVEWLDNDPTTGIAVFTNPETPDPFYDPRRDGPQARVCEAKAYVQIDWIKGIDFLRYSKIVPASNGLLKV